MGELRIEDLREEVVDLRAVNEEMRVFSQLVQDAHEGIGIVSAAGTILYANPAYQAMYGFEALDAVLGESVYSLVEGEAELLEQAIAQAMTGQSWRGDLVQRRQDGSTFPASLSLFGIQHAAAEQIEVAGLIVHDLGARYAREHTRLQEAMIAAQQGMIRELSTPVIPVLEGILVLPIIGTVDEERAQRITEVVLRQISAARARVLIMDITGVSLVDTAVASTLIRTAEAARLLGAEVVLVGITPAVAQTIVQLGVDLQGLTTRSDLRSGVEYALQRLGRTIVTVAGAR